MLALIHTINKKSFPMKYTLLLLAIMLCFGCKVNSQSEDKSAATTKAEMTQEAIASGITPIVKTAEEWKAQLNDQEYNVLREEGTERPFTGDLLKNKKEGSI